MFQTEGDTMETEEKPNMVSANADMLHGPLAKKLLVFALPIAASSILQQLFNSADVAVAGRFAEEGALAAVGSNSVLVGLFVNLFVGLSVGVNVVVSQYIGQQRTKDVNSVVHTSVLFSILCGLFVMAVGLVSARFLHILIDTPADVLDRAVLYLRIYCLAIPFITLYNFISAVLRSIGDTRRPMFCLIISGVLNVFLNLFLVIVFHLGVAGVAIATVISNIVSTGIIVWILCHERESIRMEFRKLRINPRQLKRVVWIGVPAAVQSAVFSISNICLQTAVNSFGSSAVAGMAAALNFEYFGYFIINAFAQTAITFIGQNYGAAQYPRCRKILRLCMLEGIIGSAALTAIILIGRNTLIQVYTIDPQEIEFAMYRMTLAMPFLFLESTYEITGSALRGMGRSALPALFTVIGTVVFRVFWVYAVFPHWNSFPTLISVYPVSWALTGGMMILYYFGSCRSLFSGEKGLQEVDG